MKYLEQAFDWLIKEFDTERQSSIEWDVLYIKMSFIYIALRAIKPASR